LKEQTESQVLGGIFRAFGCPHPGSARPLDWGWGPLLPDELGPLNADPLLLFEVTRFLEVLSLRGPWTTPTESEQVVLSQPPFNFLRFFWCFESFGSSPSSFWCARFSFLFHMSFPLNSLQRRGFRRRFFWYVFFFFRVFFRSQNDGFFKLPLRYLVVCVQTPTALGGLT